jgi:hypothetical protein
MALTDAQIKKHIDWHKYVTTMGPHIVDALRRIDPSLRCWWEEFQNNIVVQVAIDRDAWFGIDSDEGKWYASVLDHREGGYTGGIETEVLASALDPWLIAQGIHQAAKKLQGRV